MILKHAPRNWLPGAAALASLAALIVLAVETRAEEGEAMRLYAAQEFDRAIELCAGQTDNPSLIILACSYAEREALYAAKSDREQRDSCVDQLESSVGVVDLRELSAVIGISANPNGVKLATGLVELVFEKVTSLPDLDATVAFLPKASEGDATLAALKAIRRHLEQVREYVRKGGTMPPAERNFFSRIDLCEKLVSLLDSKDTESQSRQCLVLIGEPALQTLESSGGKAALQIAAEIRKAAAERVKKNPNSTWYGKAESKG